MWSVILCKCSGMETLNCFVHIYQFYISSWKLNLLLPESSKIQAVALSAQGEHMPATLSNISCLHWRFAWFVCFWKVFIITQKDPTPLNQEKAIVEAFSVNVKSSRGFVGSSGGKVWCGSILSPRYLLERVMWKLIKVFAPWLLAAGGLGVGVTAHHCRSNI